MSLLSGAGRHAEKFRGVRSKKETVLVPKRHKDGIASSKAVLGRISGVSSHLLSLERTLYYIKPSEFVKR